MTSQATLSWLQKLIKHEKLAQSDISVSLILHLYPLFVLRDRQIPCHSRKSPRTKLPDRVGKVRYAEVFDISTTRARPNIYQLMLDTHRTAKRMLKKRPKRLHLHRNPKSVEPRTRTIATTKMAMEGQLEFHPSTRVDASALNTTATKSAKRFAIVLSTTR